MPHVCGDEPEMQALNVLHSGVCPTYVGMTRIIWGRRRLTACMPHVCGDEPRYMGYSIAGTMVCPTYVGMNRGNDTRSGWKKRMPHVCGDEPYTPHTYHFVLQYAPRRWG